jgi:hypothetical protein
MGVQCQGRPFGSRFSKLGEQRYLKIQNDLARGVPALTMARVIQQEWGEFTDVAERTLTQQLVRLRIRMAKGLLGEEPKEQLQSIAISNATVVKRIARGAPDLLQEAYDLMEAQSRRYKRFLVKEETSATINPSLNVLMNDYLDFIERTQKLRFELGLDEFHSMEVPAMVGRRASVTTTLPDGTTVHKQAYEGYATVEKVLNKLGV